MTKVWQQPGDPASAWVRDPGQRRVLGL